MVITQFEDSLVKYYGKHQSEYVQEMTVRYVKGGFEESCFKRLLEAILKSHPFNYGFPDVAAVEEAHDRHFKKENETLRKKRAKKEWVSEEAPLTEEERAEAEENRQKWEEMVAEAAKNKTSIQDAQCEGCTHETETGNNYFCRGCLQHNKYEEKE